MVGTTILASLYPDLAYSLAIFQSSQVVNSCEGGAVGATPTNVKENADPRFDHMPTYRKGTGGSRIK